MNKFQLLEWALEYDAYKRLAYGPDRLVDVVSPLRNWIDKTGKVPEWAGVDLLRGLAFFLNRRFDWSGDPESKSNHYLISQLKLIADAVDRHPDSQPKDRFNPHISLNWKKHPPSWTSPSSWTATVLLGGAIDAPTPSFEHGISNVALYRICEAPGGYRVWVLTGGVMPNEAVKHFTDMPAEEFCDSAMHIGFYPNFSGAKNAANTDAIERLYMAKPA